ncbi:putative non-specific serine/threonine protein kinase [Helianthus anomalus]
MVSRMWFLCKLHHHELTGMFVLGCLQTQRGGMKHIGLVGGCVRRTLLDCKSGTDEFKRYFNVKLPNTQTSWFNMGMALQACEAEYLKNCTCMAYANTNITGETSGCLLWFRHSVTSYTCPTETTGLIRKLSTLLRNIILNLNF